jgi:hypothetical protein
MSNLCFSKGRGWGHLNKEKRSAVKCRVIISCHVNLRQMTRISRHVNLRQMMRRSVRICRVTHCKAPPVVLLVGQMRVQHYIVGAMHL